MRKLYSKLAFLILIVISLLPGVRNAIAVENPTIVPNNPFGIHIIDEHDLEDAAKLVNSTGGDWGYVTLVIRKDERDNDRWQNVFNRMRKLHLIPIVRLATQQRDGGWEKPVTGEMDGWITFLDSLNWVTTNRYIVIANEPNHAGEWGGEVNPEEYADYLYEFSKKLKNTSPEFFVLPAGLDASAPSANSSLNEADFIKRMLEKKPELFDYLDGWTSHSYPNPGFSASEDQHGKGTVRTYVWELDYLKSLGVRKELPVFITETGWSHDLDSDSGGLNESVVSKRIMQAYETAWKNERIIAITPFVLNYQEEPFDKFSWKKPDGSFYQFYYDVQNMPKLAGKPKQNNLADVKALIVPPIFPGGGKLKGVVYATNNGQTIWESDEQIEKDLGKYKVEIEPVKSEVEPGQSTFAILNVDY